MNDIKLNNTDIEKIHSIINKMGVNEFELSKDESGGIGYTLDMTFWTTVSGVLCQVTVPIASAEDW